jgi:hypothetical protein
MVETFSARSGQPSLRVNGAAIHSAYDPASEAARFIDGLFSGPGPSTVVLLGEGLGYASAELRRRFPRARLLVVFYSREVFLCSGRILPSDPLCRAWHPGDPVALVDFLRAAVGELDVDGLRLAEWRPSARAFPQESRDANRAVQTAVQEASGSLFTTAASGRLWIRNTLLNFLCLEEPARIPPVPRDVPLVIAASGPSLEGCIPLIQRLRRSLTLWALPSAVQCLGSAGIDPDLVIMTDPSHWSITHLHHARPACPVAMPLSAAAGSWRLGVPAALISQAVFFETEVLARAMVSVPVVPPHGTVAATALDLALAFTSAPVILAGLDLCTRDMQLHARPGAFEHLLWLKAGRLHPQYSQSVHRALDQVSEVARGGPIPIRMPRSLRTYAGWLGHAGSTATAPGRLMRLCPSPVPLAGAAEITEGGFTELMRTSPGRQTARPPARPLEMPGRRQRREIALSLVLLWRREMADGLDAVKATLGPSALLSNLRLSTLLYFVSPALLVEARRSAAAGAVAETGAAVARLREDSLAFMDLLAEKAGR